MELARNKHYQIACTRYFEVTHPNYKEKVENIEHPNLYYDLSKRIAEEDHQNNQQERSITDQIEDSMDIDDE